MDTESLTAVASSELASVADPEKAVTMAAYMRTEVPFYGVQKAGRVPVLRRLKKEFAPADRAQYEQAVLALWQLEHREEKYLAIGYATAFREYIEFDSIELYLRMIVEGAWWDFVDGIASWLVGAVLEGERGKTEPIIRRWMADPDMWLRRTSVICQLGHREATDTALLDDACTANLDDSEFFIRKAIGWALREYAKTNPEWVRSYVMEHRDELSALSYREATKHLSS